MTSLLARKSRGGATGARARFSVPAPWLAALAASAVLLGSLVGLTAAVVVVQTLDPAGGLSLWNSGVLAGRLLLLAHGAALVLPSGPLRLAPALLTLAVAWGLSRAARWAVRSPEETERRTAGAVVGAVVVVHVALLLVLAAVVDAPQVRVGWLRTTAGALLLAGAAAAWGAGRESGLVDAGLDRLPRPVRPLLRSVLSGLLAAVALCLGVVAVAVASDVSGHAAVSRALGGAAAGAVGLVGLEALLLPNAAAAVLGLAAGPGFTVGSGTVVSVHGVRLGAVPALPMLAALPDTQAVPLLAFLSQAIPVFAGLVAGGTLGRWLSDDDGGSISAALWGLLAGAGLGLASAVLVAVCGGSLGSGALAHVGAPVLATGAAVGVQSAAAAALAAAVARWRAFG